MLSGLLTSAVLCPLIVASASKNVFLFQNEVLHHSRKWGLDSSPVLSGFDKNFSYIIL